MVAWSDTTGLPGWTLWGLAWLIVTGVAAFAMHAFDKRAAIRGRRRIPEARLHLLELLGGWPGALIAMLLFRHKVRKASYLAVFIAIVVVWVAGLVFIAMTATART